MIFYELYKHGRLATRRHPMYESNKLARILSYIAAVGTIGYMIFLGTTLAFGIGKNVSNWEPYHIMNAGILPFILFLDFLARFPFQRIPTQEVKPYLLLPIKRKKLIDFLLLRSGLGLYNLIFLSIFIPFAFLTINKFFGVTGTLAYLIGIYLFFILNNYWYLLCRTLMNERAVWIALPIVFYLAVIAFFIFFDNILFHFLMDLGDEFIEGNLLCFLGMLLLITTLWSVNHKIISGIIYKEVAKENDQKSEDLSEYSFFERFGEIGEYMRLELKLLTRNKQCKTQLKNLAIMVCIFTLVLDRTTLYDKGILLSLIIIYCFSVPALVTLARIMSWEGNYLDGLMARKESILSLMKAKYYVYVIGEVMVFLLMIPSIWVGKISLLGAFAWFFYTIGATYFCYFQFAVYNRQTIPLDEKVTSRQTSGRIQMIVSAVATGFPLLAYNVAKPLVGETYTFISLLVVGLAFTVTSPLWIRNVYRRFMKRRYKNMEGFRDTRQ